MKGSTFWILSEVWVTIRSDQFQDRKPNAKEAVSGHFSERPGGEAGWLRI